MITLQSKGELLTFRPELTRFLLRNDESAGNVRSRRRARPGNPYLEGALGIAAISISHTRNAYLSAGCVQQSGVRVGPDQRYRRVAAE